MRLGRTLIGFGAAVLMAAAALLPASAASAAGYSYDGTDPAQTGCANGATTLPGYPKPIMDVDTQVGTYEVRYSASCGTNWVRVNNWYSSGTALVRMIFAREGAGGYYITDETANGAMWTTQVYAPGSTCVVYQIFVTTNGGSYSSLGEISPGLPYANYGSGTGYRQC